MHLITGAGVLLAFSIAEGYRRPKETSPIVGPRTLAQLDDALAVLDRSLDDAACDALVHPGSAVVDFHNTAGWMRATVD